MFGVLNEHGLTSNMCVYALPCARVRIAVGCRGVCHGESWRCIEACGARACPHVIRATLSRRCHARPPDLHLLAWLGLVGV